MSSDFVSLLERLVRAKIEFVLVGGFAGIIHGCTYVTQDIDICCDFSVDNILKLQDAIRNLNPVHRMTPNKIKLELTEQNCNQYKNLYLDTDLGQLDCISCVDGIGDYPQVRQASQSATVEQTQLRVLTLDALIEAKKKMNRPRDKQILHQLLAIKKTLNQ